MFGYLGGMTLSMPRMVFALARDGFLPRALAIVHPTHRSPQAAIIFQSLLALVLAISGTFEKLAILANVSALVLYLGCAAASWKLRKESLSIVPLLAIVVIFWLLTGLTPNERSGFGICILAASLVYGITTLRKRV
jgi:amino acid transporter